HAAVLRIGNDVVKRQKHLEAIVRRDVGLGDEGVVDGVADRLRHGVDVAAVIDLHERHRQSISRATGLQSYLRIMQKLLLPLLLLCSLPLFAQRQFAVAPGAAMDTPAPQLLFAGSGSAQGANGTFFHSDISVLNYRTADQQVAFTWIPNGGPAAA